MKWLTEIEVIRNTFSGYFQTHKYVYALITQPGDDEVMHLGTMAVRGLAWSGATPIARVEVSLNGQASRPARLLGQGSSYGWQRWELITRIDMAGRVVIGARATDQAGRTQPERPQWNCLGYGNNAIHEVSIRTR